MVGDEVSPIGRTKTAPAAGAPLDRFRFAMASCAHFEHGYFGAYRHLAEEDVDLAVFLGDYVYEYAANGEFRGGDGPVRLVTGERDRHPGGVPRPARALQDRPGPAGGARGAAVAA